MEVTPPYKQWIADKERDAFIRALNPLMKIPILVDNGFPIFDSRMIVGYLWDRRTSEPELRGPSGSVEEDNIITVIYGIIDAAVLTYVMGATHPETRKDTGYMSRSMERIAAGLEWLDQQETLGQSFGVPEIALICGLEWFKKRNVIAWDGYKHLAEVYKKYCDRASLVKTRIPESM
jgi:glutathione S-transferase